MIHWNHGYFPLTLKQNFEILFKGVRILDEELTDELTAKGLGFRQNYVDIYSNSWGPEDNGREVAEVGVMTEKVLSQGAFKVYNL